jgi:hypothetical protein
MWVGRSGEGGLLWWCGFNISVLGREGRRRDEVLSEDEAGRQWARLGSMGMKCDTMRWRGHIGQRRGGIGEGKGRRRRQLDWHESYWTKEIKKIYVIDSTTKNGRWRFKATMSLFIFLKIYVSEIYFCLSHHIEHSSENKILNGYHMSEINYFKVLLLCEMMWQMMLDGCWCGMIWLNADVDTLHVKRIDLNDT